MAAEVPAGDHTARISRIRTTLVWCRFGAAIRVELAKVRPLIFQMRDAHFVLSPPTLWGGWREAPGGAGACKRANSRLLKQPPPVTSFALLTMCHPPHKVGGIRKSSRCSF